MQQLIQFEQLTEEDIKNLTELYLDPVNCPTYKNSEDMRFTINIMRGITIFETFIVILISEYFIIYAIWIIAALIFAVWYKYGLLYGIKKVPGRVQKASKEQVINRITSKTFVCNDKEYSFNNITYIIFYKGIYFIFLYKKLFFAKIEENSDDQFIKMFAGSSKKRKKHLD